ncbi:MAG TPA: N-acetylmuramoyl-L-alanine amidase, partial [Rhodanobacter sp.]|nr:N-acetylmuramoyl-L-alanine amidase [Rhodanobacter sp.]
MTAAAWGAHAADVTGVRVWSDASHTRLVFDMTGKPDYQLDRGNDRVVVELARSQTAGNFAGLAARGLFRGLQQGRDGDRLQLTANMTPGSGVRSFVLAPDQGGDHYRLVVDLLPGHGDGAAPSPTPTPANPASVAAVPAGQPGEAASAVPASTPVDVADTAPRRGAAVGNSRRMNQQAAALLNGERKVVVAIDAGHGGKDSGAIGPGGTMEKNVTLAVARDLAAVINRQPGMKAILTRTSDYFIPLAQRYQIARQHDADLFISIHADSYTSGDARGSSVWVLSSRGKSSVAAQMLADRENSADLIGGVSLSDQSNGLAKVLLDMQQGWAVQASDVVATNVLRALGQIGPTHRGYVERANFVVLRSPDVPSILVETAFISNPAEEAKLRDPNHQKALADAVMSGVQRYFESTPPPGTWFAAQAARRRRRQQSAHEPAGCGAAQRRAQGGGGDRC